ncbi:FAD-binding oxidoreductase [Streptomyces sp. NPDC049906]|uniref:FAD-binding oxidoreductase n=1 Tax=Streptomyces sp. NPDC049906 TaxID=3155656 RepID=UPI0034314414
MNHADIQSLASRVAGPVLVPGDEGYDEERSGANLAVRHEPDAIVGAARAEDVREAVALAARHGLPVAVQCTGHGFAAASRGGLLVTTGRMREVEVDPERRTAWVAAGARFEDVIPVAAAHGLAPLNGSAPHVGVVSYVLGGGVGLLVRTHGYAADRVRTLELVTADGRARTVTPESDPDLFWAVVGGRDNFGIVTRLEMDLIPLSRVYGGGFFYDVEAAPDLLGTYVRWADAMPREMNSTIASLPMPDDPKVPAPIRGRHVHHVCVAYTGDPAEGERLVAPLREAAPVLSESLRDMPYTECGTIHDEPRFPVPFQRETALLREVDQEVLRLLAEHTGPGAPLPCVVELRHLAGAGDAAGERRNSVGLRDAPYLLAVVAPLYGITAEDTRPMYEKLFADLAPYSSGAALNFLGFGTQAGPERVRAAYEPADLERLTRLKAVYDPQNVFRLNYNIPPAAPR